MKGMATVFYKRYLFTSIWLLLSVLMLCTRTTVQFSYNENPESKQAFWKILESSIYPNEDSMDASNDYDENTNDEIYNENSLYEEEDVEPGLKDLDERGVAYPETRAVVHKVCKVQTIPVRLSHDGYEYSSSHYKNLTCEETTDKPLERKAPQSNEYCLIVHHPHEGVHCHTKHTRVPMFRRKSRRHPWEKIIQTVAVGSQAGEAAEKQVRSLGDSCHSDASVDYISHPRRKVFDQVSGKQHPRKKSSVVRRYSPGKQHPRKKSSVVSTSTCGKCGREHQKGKCPAEKWKCFSCGKYGHVKKLCRAKGNVAAVDEQTEEISGNVNEDLLCINNVGFSVSPHSLNQPGPPTIGVPITNVDPMTYKHVNSLRKCSLNQPGPPTIGVPITNVDPMTEVTKINSENVPAAEKAEKESVKVNDTDKGAYGNDTEQHGLPLSE
ncbi:hypothetical protein QE152_g28347 [Popillia japonica]|uniref:CCHC-type domain-containing protein n=1 Tax=Popillia japonica TaxID=7064 RepID=A0AAW1JJ58_POPJA